MMMDNQTARKKGLSTFSITSWINKENTSKWHLSQVTRHNLTNLFDSVSPVSQSALYDR